MSKICDHSLSYVLCCLFLIFVKRFFVSAQKYKIVYYIFISFSANDYLLLQIVRVTHKSGFHVSALCRHWINNERKNILKISVTKIISVEFFSRMKERELFFEIPENCCFFFFVQRADALEADKDVCLMCKEFTKKKNSTIITSLANE